MGTNSQYTLYAVWKANLNTLTFNGNGATGGSTSSMQIRTDVSATLNSNGFTKTGYTFKGWSTSVNGEVEFTDGANYTMGTNSQYILYAVWEANLNTLTFNGNGATGGSTSSMQIRTDAMATLNENNFTKLGYHFVGWSTTARGEIKYVDSADYIMGTENLYTLYAVWETIEYGITYELYGGVNNDNNPKTFTIEDLPLQLNCPTKEDEIFTVFYSDSNFSTPVTCINEIGDIALYAEFAESTFGVKYSVYSDHARVEGCESHVTHVKVLSYYLGKKVTNIEKGAFKNCNNLEFISLPFTGGSIDATTYERPFGYIFGYIKEPSYSTISEYDLTLQYTESVWNEDINGYYRVKYYYDIPRTIKHIEIREGTVSGYNFKNMYFSELSIGHEVSEVREIKTGTYYNPAMCSIDSVYYEGTPLDWYNVSDSSCNHNNLKYIGEFLSQKTYHFETNDGCNVSSITSDDIIFLPTLTRENWHFCGWHDNAEFTGTAYFNTYYNTSNTTLYAKWLTEEEYCDGSSFEKAISVTSVESITANIDTAGEKIYYKFVPTETKSYTIKSSGGLDTYGYLYDSNQSQITYNDGSKDFTITRSLTAGETYYIVVKMYSSSATGTFTVTIS